MLPDTTPSRASPLPQGRVFRFHDRCAAELRPPLLLHKQLLLYGQTPFYAYF